MSIAFLIYLITFLSSLNNFSVFLIVTLVSVSIIALIISFIEDDPRIFKRVVKYPRSMFTVIVIALILSLAIPDKRDMYIILGLVVAEQVITSDKGNELFDKSYQLVVDKIDEAIAEKKIEDKEVNAAE